MPTPTAKRRTKARKKPARSQPKTTPAELDPEAIAAVHRAPLRKGAKGKVEIATQEVMKGTWIARGAIVDVGDVDVGYRTLQHHESERQALAAVVDGFLDLAWTANAPTATLAKQRSNLVADLRAWRDQLAQEPVAPNVSQGKELQVGVDQLTALPFQPRKVFDPEPLSELAASIAKHGILQRLVVREADRQGVAKGAKRRYEIIAGERRYRAAQQAKVPKLPVIVVEATDAEALELAVVENVERESLTAVEEGDAFRALTDPKSKYRQCTQSELAERLGVSQGHIAHRIKLAGLPEPWRGRVMSRDISNTQARMLGPWSDFPGVLAALDKSFKGHKQHRPNEPLTTGDWQWMLGDAIAEASIEVRGVHHWDGKTYQHLPYELPADRFDELQVVEVAPGRRRAFNVKLAKKLRDQALSVAREKAKGKSNGKASSNGKAGKQKLTPAQQKKRAQELAAQHRKRIDRWRMTWLRQIVASKLTADDEWVRKVLAHAAVIGEDDRHRGSRQRAFKQAGASAGVKVVEKGSFYSKEPYSKQPDAFATLAGAKDLRGFALCLARELVVESLADRFVEAIAAGLKVDLAAEWKGLPKADGALFREFVELHSRDQLLKLARELKVTLPGGGKKSELVDLFTGALPQRLPKSIATVKAGKGRR